VEGLSPDNAQNWYRHQLAELGIVGSVAWMLWVGLFAVYVVRSRADSLEAWCTRGGLVALAVVSFVGMPGQEASVAVTFWTLAAWFIRATAGPPPTELGLRQWSLAAIAVVLYAAGTLSAAVGALRVPMRAQRAGWPYEYGLYDGTGAADGMRWTARRAVVVVQSDQPYVELTMAADYRTLGDPDNLPAPTPIRPVVAIVRRDGARVFTRELTTTAPVTLHLPVRAESPWLFLETEVSRVFRPRELGISDDRELGIQLRWRFVDAPPP
jgi:hypothetical protein